MKLKLSLLSLVITLVQAAHAATWSFAVAGDDRTDVVLGPIDPTGIHTEVVKNLLTSIAEKKPAFLLFTGDLVYGENPLIASNLAEQFEAWKKLAAQFIPDLTILPVRGNHETYSDPEGKKWLAAFKPGLDDLKVSYFPKQEGFSYLYIPPSHPQVAIIALDQFMPGAKHRVDLVGLENALKKAREQGATYLFVFAHEMAFTCVNHPDSDNMAAFPAERNQFLELLRRYDCRYFFAGHDHAYDWMEISHPDWPKEYHLNQIVAGTAGAPFYKDKTYFGNHDGYDLIRVDHKQNTYGYLLVTINEEEKEEGKACTVSFIPVAP